MRVEVVVPAGVARGEALNALKRLGLTRERRAIAALIALEIDEKDIPQIDALKRAGIIEDWSADVIGRGAATLDFSWPPPFDGSHGLALSTVGLPFGAWPDLKARGGVTTSYSPTSDGAGVDIYVVDSGIDPSHAEFSGRFGGEVYDAHPSDAVFWHGTVSAGCAAGATVGMAPGATVFDCRVLDANNSVSLTDFVDGLDACVMSHAGRSNPGVVNMSLAFRNPSSGTRSSIDSALSAAKDAGLVLIAAADNDSIEIAEGGTSTYPAESPHSFAVGCTDYRRRRAPYSNYGAKVRLWAAGDHTTSAQYGGGLRPRVLGTSFSATLVAGVAARLLQGTSKMASAAEVVTFYDALEASNDGLPVLDVDGVEIAGAKFAFLAP